jgi:hypothetical protein
MEYRPLGRTGVQVSKLCLGTMMFGAWGNADHGDSTRIIHAAFDAGKAPRRPLEATGAGKPPGTQESPERTRGPPPWRRA